MYQNYEKFGVEGYYKKHGDDYENPHLPSISYLFPKFLKEAPISKDSTVLDLACGSGEITNLLIKHGHDKDKITGLDPYTNKNYEKNTKCKCLGNSFQDILSGKLSELNYDNVICSYAIHLVKNEEMFTFLMELANITPRFIVLTQKRKFSVNHFQWKIAKEVYYPEEKVKLLDIKRIETE